MHRPLALLAALVTLACASPPHVAAIAPVAPRDEPSPAGPRADTSPYFAYQTIKLAEGAYAFVPPEPKTSIVSGNSVVIVGDDGALVVDTGHFPSLARKMIADVRRLTDQPVRYVVNTHWHPDHVFGNAAYREAFPDAVVLAHAETRRLMVKDDPQYIDQQRDFAALLSGLRTAQATGKHRSGAPLTAAERTEVAETITELEGILGDANVTLSPQTMTFGSDLTVHLGKREVRVMHLGRGNTAGDAIVYLPDAKVLVTGDLVVAPTPYAYGSYIGEWIETLKKLRAIDAATLVPGHGPVQHGFAYVDTLVSLLGATLAQVTEAQKGGLTLEQTKAKVDLRRFEDALAAGDPGRTRAFRSAYLDPAVERAYQEAKGKLEDE